MSVKLIPHCGCVFKITENLDKYTYLVAWIKYCKNDSCGYSRDRSGIKRRENLTQWYINREPDLQEILVVNFKN